MILTKSAALLTRTILILSLFISCSEKQITWVAIGDSITYLNNHQDETGNRVTKGYLTRVTEMLPEIKYINKGYNGWTAVRIAEEIKSLELTKADVYSVFLGTNDWWHGKPLGTLEDYKNNRGNHTYFGAYRSIVNTLRELNPEARIILLTPMQRGDFVYIANMKNNAFGSYKIKAEQSLAQFADAVVAIGRHEKMEVVDLFHLNELALDKMVKFKRLKDPATGLYKNYTYPDYIDIPFNPEIDEYPYPIESIDVTYDGLHPSDKGYEIITQSLVNLLKRQ